MNINQQKGDYSDSPKINSKVVHLHYNNKFLSVPIAYANTVEENYENMKNNPKKSERQLLYDHTLRLKVIALLMV